MLARGLAAPEFLPVELLAARHLDDHMVGERVHHRDADAMQAARGFIGAGVELAARVQRGHDDFEGGLVLELGVRVDGDAAAIVGDGQIAVRGVADVDPGGVAGHRLVHGVVEHFGEEMVQRLLVGAADIHAGAAADGLEPFQHLDVGGGIALLAARLGRAFGACGLGAAGRSSKRGWRTWLAWPFLFPNRFSRSLSPRAASLQHLTSQDRGGVDTRPSTDAK